MRIAIIGGGVSGLSLYIKLRNDLPDWERHTVNVYESRRPGSKSDSHSVAQDDFNRFTDTTAVVGNSIALTGNFMRLLQNIDPRLHDLYKGRGYVNENFVFKTAHGWTLATIPVGRGPEDVTVSSPRHVLWDCLQEIAGPSCVHYLAVKKVHLGRAKPVVEFNDGRIEEFDLVVGADGVRSVVKRALFGDADENTFAPRFEGFCGVGSFIDTDIPPSIEDKRSMVFTFGPTGSFGYCSSAPSSERRLGWWSNWGAPTIPKSNLVDPSDVRNQLQARHGRWADRTIQTCIRNSETDRIYPIWTTPPLPYWGRDGALLIGDAAHTLQATSGQGAGQAMTDSVTLSLLLKHLLEQNAESVKRLSDREVVEVSIKALYDIRNDQVAVIRQRAKNLYLSRNEIKSTISEYIYYLYLFLMLRFPIIGQIFIGGVFTGFERVQSPVQAVQMYLKLAHIAP